MIKLSEGVRAAHMFIILIVSLQAQRAKPLFNDQDIDPTAVRAPVGVRDTKHSSYHYFLPDIDSFF